ncbi:hypothetical protein AB0I53_32980 [Saccharopolyspora sp. NPDC050389]|uniref:hypothetical protein n=1 Tax=Saccharopolyspora sp. NPDC050389 TaxID=3155516 RepID=UPI0033EF83E2
MLTSPSGVTRIVSLPCGFPLSLDAGDGLAEFTGVLVHDSYAGYTHLTAVHAWYGATSCGTCD